MTRYTVTMLRPDGEEQTGTIITDGNFNTPEELGETYAESFGYELVSVKESSVGDQNNDPLKRESQQPDDQNKDVNERVEKQSIETKEVRPQKTGDVKPDR